MLRLWRDQLRVVLCPGRVVLMRLSGGMRPRVVAKELVEFPQQPGESWRPALDALRGVIKKFTTSAGTTVVLSNHFVRYRLISWSTGLSGEDEERSWVARQFDDTIASVPAQLDYRWDADNASGACFASAIDRDLIAGIEAAFSGHALRLESIQPYLMFAFNRWRTEFSGRRLWFVLCEAGYVCLGLAEQGQWRAIRSCRIDGDWRAEVPVLLRREMLLVDDNENTEILIHYAGLADAELRRLELPALRPLSLPAMAGYSPLADSAYAMALSGG